MTSGASSSISVPKAGKITIPIWQKSSSCTENSAANRQGALICKNSTVIEGKSTAMGAVVKCFLLFAKSVLVTSHTSSSTIFADLPEDIPADDMLRIGNPKSVKEEKLKSIITERYEAMKKTLTSVVRLGKLSGQRVYSVPPPLFSFRNFDVCLVDEASLAVESSLLAPLSACSRFVLAGDAPSSSPPWCKAARQRSSAWTSPSSSGCRCTRRPRQASHRIAALASKLFYDGLLKCATDGVADGRLQFRKILEVVRN
ncbi:unnamed protein product, partial [Mesorhabditis spiculigera]